MCILTKCKQFYPRVFEQLQCRHLCMDRPYSAHGCCFNGTCCKLMQSCGEQNQLWWERTLSILYARRRRVVLYRALRPSVCLFVHPSVNFSCPLHNSDTVQDTFMKLGTNINHYQTMCREQEPTLHLHFYGLMAL